MGTQPQGPRTHGSPIHSPQIDLEGGEWPAYSELVKSGGSYRFLQRIEPKHKTGTLGARGSDKCPIF